MLLARNRLPVWALVYYDNLPKRIEITKEFEELCWTQWIKQVFPSLVSFMKWKVEYRNPCVGDVVLEKYDSKVTKGDYCLARISWVYPDHHGVIRTVTGVYLEIL